MTRWIGILVMVLLAVGCGGNGNGDGGKEPDGKTPVPASLGKMMLDAAPGGSLSVADAKALDAEEVVVIGRIQEVLKGYASFKLIDMTLDYCGFGADVMDDCKTPWDYCCLPQPEITAAILLVEARDGGKIVKTPEIPGLRLLDTVVVTGKRTKDEHGNVTVVADGWYRQERPTLGDDLIWPK